MMLAVIGVVDVKVFPPVTVTATLVLNEAGLV